jgi:nucleoside-diphosphate-sugar epimerase
MEDSMKVLVLGGTGTVGSQVVVELVARKAEAIIGVGRGLSLQSRSVSLRLPFSVSESLERSSGLLRAKSAL